MILSFMCCRGNLPSATQIKTAGVRKNKLMAKFQQIVKQRGTYISKYAIVHVYQMFMDSLLHIIYIVIHVFLLQLVEFDRYLLSRCKSKTFYTNAFSLTIAIHQV